MPVSSNELLQQLRWRYATKKFDPAKKIPGDFWKTLEETLVLAPSSFGLQPWKFTVVTNAELREKLKSASWNQAQITDASHLVVFSAKKTLTPADADKLIETTAKARGIPATALDGYKQMIVGTIQSRTSEHLHVWNSRQVYIALGSFLTAAALLGIDACPMEGINGPDYDTLLGLDKEGYATVCVATVGYRAADDPYADSAKVRYPVEELIGHR